MADIVKKGQGKTPYQESVHCAVGIYPGTRTFQGGEQVSGVFGMIGIEDPCDQPVTARCQLLINGRLAPYYWMACDNPDHRKDAGVIEHLDPFSGRVLRTERFLPGPQGECPAPAFKTMRELATGEPPYSPPKRIPRNKGNKAQKRAAKLLKE